MNEKQRRRNLKQNRSNQRQRRNQGSQAKHFKNKEYRADDKKVPLKYEVKQTKVLETIELKFEIDELTEKVKLTIFEDGTDEQFLKLLKEFRNMIETYELWTKPNGTQLIYRSFR
jgi:hypothetical protein